MIKEKELREARASIRYSDGEGISLSSIQAAIQKEADDKGLPIKFCIDQVKYAGFGGGTEDCLVIFHPEHEKDYLRLCIRVKYQGTYAFISTDEFGSSKQLDNQSSHEFLSETMKHGSASEKVGALLGAGVRRLFKGKHNKKALEEEKTWYTVLHDILDKLFQ